MKFVKLKENAVQPMMDGVHYKCCRLCPKKSIGSDPQKEVRKCYFGYSVAVDWTGAVNTGFQRKVWISFLFRDRKNCIKENSENKNP